MAAAGPWPGARGRAAASRALNALAFVLFGALSLTAPGPVRAQDDTLTVALAPRDAESRMAIEVVKTLKQDPALANVEFTLFPWQGSTQEDVAAMSEADVALVSNMGRDIAEAVAPAISVMKTRDARAYAFGGGFEAAEAQAGMTPDPQLLAYGEAGGKANWISMIRYVLARDFGYDLTYDPPAALPMVALWDWRTGRVHDSFESYRQAYLQGRPAAAADAPFVAIAFDRGTAVMGASENIAPIAEALESRGLNVAPAYSYPSELAVEQLLTRPGGGAYVEAIVGTAFRFNNVPERTVPLLQVADVPIVNAIALYDKTLEQWEASTDGLSIGERNFQIATPEFAGLVAPTVYATKEQARDEASGLTYTVESAVPERVERLADRIAEYVRLRQTPNAEKRVALVYYNYPPGRENVGASYLNVLPRSLWEMLNRMRDDGYDVGDLPATERELGLIVQDHAVNAASWDSDELARVAGSGEAILLPVSVYRGWFDDLPASLRDSVADEWGAPEDADVMVWRNEAGEPFFVFPAHRFGGVLLAAQPSRGWEETAHDAHEDAHGDESGEGEGGHDHDGEPHDHQDASAAYHSSHLPPHHQYLAFYLWLQHGFGANAMVHVGTHGTHEWLPGREIGFTGADPGEVLMGAVPQIYPYIVDDIGEGLQAKRRGMAALISHMTPPFDAATLSPELRQLNGLVSDYLRVAGQSVSAAEAALGQIDAFATETGILSDIGLERVETAQDADELAHYLEEVAGIQTPFGLHTFGVSPGPQERRQTAEAILSVIPGLDDAERAAEAESLAATIERSGPAEMDALMAALDGRYVPAGPGNDPIRNPGALPTGRNMYGFDPTRIPTPGTWAQGQDLAEAFIDDYRARNDGAYPDRVTFTLWAVEAMRHEGVTEAEIMALMGVRPTWNARGRIQGVEVIPAEELGRPRVDVTIVPSGLYRDSLPNLMEVLDDAVSQLVALDEPGNPIRMNWLTVRNGLEAGGVNAEDAARIAAVRIFTEPPGSYGTGVSDVVGASNYWDADSQVADVYFNRVGYLFGQGFWGDRPLGDDATIGVFKQALSGSKAVLHSSSSNLYGVLDNDDVYQYVGGAAMAVRQIDGATPDIFMVNLADPADPRHETLERYLGREMRSRYLNPKWIEEMLDEGYAGARFIAQTVENLWGWEVTDPDAVDDDKWRETYETYVLDENGLEIEERFREADNLRALQAMADRMLTVIEKGYWDADAQTRAELEAFNQRLIAEVGRACDVSNCSSSALAAPASIVPVAVDAALDPALSAAAPPPEAAAQAAAEQPAASSPAPRAPSGRQAAQVEGFAIEETPSASAPSDQPLDGRVILVFLVAAGLVGAGAAWRGVRGG